MSPELEQRIQNLMGDQPISEPMNMRRADGSKKSARGFLGPVTNYASGNPMTEFSTDMNWQGKKIEIPTMIPSLSDQEIEYMRGMKEGEGWRLSESEIERTIINKAKRHARERLEKGKNPFYQDGEEKIQNDFAIPLAAGGEVSQEEMMMEAMEAEAEAQAVTDPDAEIRAAIDEMLMQASQAEDSTERDQYLHLAEAAEIGSKAPMAQMAVELTQAGRGEDTALAHLRPGEVIIPPEAFEDEEFESLIEKKFNELDIDPRRMVVGVGIASLNPITGLEEFGGWWKKTAKSLKKVAKKVIKPLAKVAQFIPGPWQPFAALATKAWTVYDVAKGRANPLALLTVAGPMATGGGLGQNISDISAAGGGSFMGGIGDAVTGTFDSVRGGIGDLINNPMETIFGGADGSKGIPGLLRSANMSGKASGLMDGSLGDGVVTGTGGGLFTGGGLDKTGNLGRFGDLFSGQGNLFTGTGLDKTGKFGRAGDFLSYFARSQGSGAGQQGAGQQGDGIETSTLEAKAREAGLQAKNRALDNGANEEQAQNTGNYAYQQVMQAGQTGAEQATLEAKAREAGLQAKNQALAEGAPEEAAQARGDIAYQQAITAGQTEAEDASFDIYMKALRENVPESEAKKMAAAAYQAATSGGAQASNSSFGGFNPFTSGGVIDEAFKTPDWLKALGDPFGFGGASGLKDAYGEGSTNPIASLFGGGGGGGGGMNLGALGTAGLAGLLGKLAYDEAKDRRGVQLTPAMTMNRYGGYQMAKRDAQAAGQAAPDPVDYGMLPAEMPLLSGGRPAPVMTARYGGAVQPMAYADGGNVSNEDFKRKNGGINGEGTEVSDDVPAMLSDGEFVMTGQAVRGAGSFDLKNDNGIITLTQNGDEDREKGTQLMYQMMDLFAEFAGKPNAKGVAA